MRLITREQVEQIIGAIDTGSRSGLRARAALHLAYSGLTSGEIVRVRRDEVSNLDRKGSVHIPTRPRGQDVPLRDVVCSALRAWLHVAPASPWLLCTYTQGAEGNPISDGDVRAACDRAVEAAGLDSTAINPTVIRESYAWQLARQGASREDIAEIMGWAQLRSTERIMRAPAPDLGDRVRQIDTQPPLPTHASADEARELREQVDALRTDVRKLDTRDDIKSLDTRVAEHGASIADVRRILDARLERIERVEEIIGELLCDLGRGELQQAIAERQREERERERQLPVASCQERQTADDNGERPGGDVAPPLQNGNDGGADDGS